MKFTDVEWGNSEAKGDINLKDYFYEFPEFDGIKDGKYRYVIGRKGTGKTAVIETIKNKIEVDPLSFYSEMSLKEFPITVLKELRDKGYEGKSQYVPVWEFLILSEICRIILWKDNGAYHPEAIEDLRRFYSDNNIEHLSATQTLTVLRERQSKFNVSALLKYLQASIGFDDKKSVSMVMDVHFQKISTALKELLKKLSTNSKYYIFLDELDEEFKANDKSNKTLLLSLLRAVENLKTFFDTKTTISFNPVVALRSDIFNTMQDDNDVNKLHDYIVKLDWSIDFNDTNKSSMSIINIINKRISHSINQADATWGDIINDRDVPSYVKGGLWQYITTRGFSRPRDVIKYLKICSERNPIHDLSFKNVVEAESEYSDWLYNELRNEIHSHLPVWAECLNVFREVGYYRTHKKDFIEKIVAHPKVKKYMEDSSKTADEITEELFNFSVIGNIIDSSTSSSRWSFKYKDDDVFWNREADLLLHFGISKKFSLPTYKA